jgi:DNA-binding SARP family transcriptional activator/pimeloyl-ACP methyl ester carboxylesterase
MEFSILGPVEASADGRPLGLGGARTRALLATLLVHANHVVPADQLIDEVWPELPAGRAAASLQARLSGLRKLLRSAGPDDRLVTRPPGYLLRVGADELDARRFEEGVAAGNDMLAADGPGRALGCLDEALRLWRGPALAGVDTPSARTEAGRLEELRLGALESRAQAQLDCGRLPELIAELETLTAANPLRERLWLQWMLALYRAGRQADALRAYAELRTVLAGELGIEPAAALRELHGQILRQDPALEARAPRRRNADGDDRPQTRYVLTPDGVHIAYQVLGQGPRDIVFVPGLMSHLDLLWEDPDTAGFFRRLATLGRLILFDKRDTGLSDRAVGDSSMDERVSDVEAVMSAAGSVRAVLFGYSEGAPMSILFAAVHPQRVSALILGSAAARMLPAPDYPCGEHILEVADALRKIAANRWGQGDSIDWYLPSRAASPHARALFARFERLAVTPGAFLRMLAFILDIDVRSVLPAIHVPTLIIQRLGDRITPPFHGRYLASRIAGARYFEQPGDHSLRFAGSGDRDALVGEIAEFLRIASRPAEPDRVLATIMAGDRAPGSDERRLVQEHGGRLITAAGPATLASFSTPGRAIRCGHALRAADPAAPVRCGIHAGEVALAGDEVTGAAVRIAQRVARLARPGEVLVSRTVRDLVAGSGYRFTDRGNHRLADAPDSWQLFAVEPDGRPPGDPGRADRA